MNLQLLAQNMLNEMILLIKKQVNYKKRNGLKSNMQHIQNSKRKKGRKSLLLLGKIIVVNNILLQLQ